MILRDPVHGLVAFESAEEQIVPDLLESAEVQRLRRVRQLGLASLAYPGADHTRFSHALGAAHVMSRFIRRLRQLDGDLPYWQRLTSERAHEALAAALLHDVGHGPFSHLFEDALPDGPSHEEWTRRVVLDPGTDVHRALAKIDAQLPERVADLVRGQHSLAFLARAVSGTFDVDRCDYLLRDAHFTGVSYGRFDLDWLLRSFCFGVAPSPAMAPHLAVDGAKGLTAIESFLLARLFMFQQVYFHKASRASETMLRMILSRVRDLLVDGERLPAVPAALAGLARDGDAALGEYLELDDGALWQALSAWRDGPDPLLADLCRRLVARQLFKTYELYGAAREPDARDRALEVARDLAARRGLEPDAYVALDLATDVPYDDASDPLTVLFPTGEPRRPSDVSFLLGRLHGERLERIRLIVAPELRDDLVKALES